MIFFATFLLGGILGVALWGYISGFIERLQQEIYSNYIELFPQNQPLFQPHRAVIKQKKCGHLLVYFFLVGFLFTLLSLIFHNALFVLWLGLTLLLLWAISYLDWHYQLISPIPCLWLLVLSLLGANMGFSYLTLEESLQSAVGFFLVFYAIYWIAKSYYGKEAFGRGDYWLSPGLGSLIPLQNLPHFLLLACLLGICTAIFYRARQDFMPFAPFLCTSMLIMRGIYYV